MTKYHIIAPHIDDETIGCYNFLINNQIEKVYYVFETQERIQEASKAATYFNFDFEVLDIENFHNIPKNKTLLVPNIKDGHIHHKLVNLAAKCLPNNKCYYSVDMNTFRMPIKNWQDKRDILNFLYPSQKEYFNQNSQCYLFENVMQSDCKLTISIPVKINNSEIVLTMIDSIDIEDNDISIIKSILEREYEDDISPENFLDKIFQSEIFENYLASLKLSIKNLETQIIETVEFSTY